MYIPLCVWMRSGHHLREIYHCNMTFVIDHQVKLVEVSVNDTTVCQSHDEVHTVTVRLRSISYLLHIAAEILILIISWHWDVILSNVHLFFPTQNMYLKNMKSINISLVLYTLWTYKLVWITREVEQTALVRVRVRVGYTLSFQRQFSWASSL